MSLVTTDLLINKRIRAHPATDGNGQRFLEVYADISWTNGSDENHWIEISVDGEIDPLPVGDGFPPAVTLVRVFTRPRDTTSSERVLLTRWRAVPSPVLFRDITVTVKATNGTTSSTPVSEVHTVELAETVSDFSAPYYENGEIILPQIPTDGESPEMAFSSDYLGNIPNVTAGGYPNVPYLVDRLSIASGPMSETGYIEIRPLGVTPNIKQKYVSGVVYAPVLYIRGIAPYAAKVPRALLSKYLLDSGFYSVKIVYPKPKVLTTWLSAGSRWGLGAQVSETVEFNMTLEYWVNGPKLPVLTSSPFITIPIDLVMTYKPTTIGGVSFASSDIGSITDIYEYSLDAETGEIVAQFATAGSYTMTLSITNAQGTTDATLNIEVTAFAAYPASATLQKNVAATVPLSSSHDATWALTTGTLPTGMALRQSPSTGVPAAIVGTPTAIGSYSFTLTATKKGGAETSDAVILINVLTAAVSDSAPLTEIVGPSNASEYSSDEPLIVGEYFSIGLVSKPVNASWVATGLPTGVTIDANTGLISGRLLEAGRFSAVVTAQAEGYQRSLPVLIVASVDPAAATVPNGSEAAVGALTRIPWIADEWNLIDIQIDPRTRSVKSSLAGEGGILIKAGDDINFVVFFIGSNDRPFALTVDKLSLTIREANNLEDPVVFETAASPSLDSINGDSYYTLTSAKDGSGRNEMRDIVESWVARAAKSGGDKTTSVLLPCVADVEWEVNSQTFSSRNFPVLIEFDVTR